VGNLESQEDPQCGSSLETLKELMFESEGRKELMSQLKAVRQEEYLLLKEGSAFCTTQASNCLTLL
jgi:hypothetical protein